MATVFSYQFSQNPTRVLPSVTLSDGTEVTNYIVHVVGDITATDEESGTIASHPICAELTAPSDRDSEGYVDILQATEMPQFCIDVMEAAFNDEGNRSVLEMQLNTLMNQPVTFNAPWDDTQPDPPEAE